MTPCAAPSPANLSAIWSSLDARELHATIQMALARREVEVAVESSELRLKLAMEAASLGVFEWLPQFNRMRGDGHLGAVLAIDRCRSMKLGIIFLCGSMTTTATGSSPASSGSTGLRQRGAHRVPHRAHQRRPTFSRSQRQGLPRHQRPATRPRYPAGCQRTPSHRGPLAAVQRGLSSAAAAIAIVNVERRVAAVNAAFTRITGYSEAEAIGLDLDLLLRVQRGKQIGSEGFFGQLALAADGFWEGQVFCQRRNGESFPSWQSVSVVPSAAGKPTIS